MVDLSAIEELEEQIYELEQEREDIENNEANKIEEYDDMLDEQGTITIGNLSYSPSHVLHEVDPIAYNMGYNEYFDERLSEINEEIKSLQEEIQELKNEGE